MPVESRNSDQPVLPPWALRLMALGALGVLVGAATPPGAAVAATVQRFLVFYAGVFALVAMSTSVVSGLIATERLILAVRHRVMAQALHRAASLIAVTFLVAHFMVKVLDGQATAAQIVVPYAGPVGLGALAFDLLMVVVLTGMLRARFAASTRPWLWRFFHSTAYLSWPVAIVHGLSAGRVPAGWVTWGYALCLIGVGLAVLTRLMVTVRPRSVPRGAPDTMPAPAAELSKAGARSRQEAMR